MAQGKIVQCIGAVVDVEFPRNEMPRVYDALKLEGTALTLEVQQQLGDGVVRTIALGSSEGLRRGLMVTNTNAAITVPVGKATLGRIMDVLGNPIDERGPVSHELTASIHRKAPVYDELSPSTELLETGIKVIDLMCPFAKGGKVEEVERQDQPQDEDDADGTGNTVWLRSTKFADDMDRVLRRKDGRLTYIASDVAYHRDKFSRPLNADKLITVLGPDHHGYIGRLTAVVAALLERPDQHGDGTPLDPIEARIYRTSDERDACAAALAEAKERLEVVIFQIVRFVKEGKPAPMRKRDGNIYALIDLLDELGKIQAPDADLDEQRRIGRDVARYFYLMRSHETHMDFDIDLATKRSDENPVFYVQYAHARIEAVLRKAEEEGLVQFGMPSRDVLGLLTDPRERALIKKIADLPWEVRRCAEDYGVHRLTSYAVELARAYHHFYDGCRVVQPTQPDLSRARIALCRSAQIGLRAVFGLLGISAPERM